MFIGEFSSSINSPVISMSLDSCPGSKRRRKRSAVSLSSGASTTVDINLAPSSGISVNETPSADNDAIIISLFNLTSSGSTPVLLRVEPKTPSEVNVFVRRNATPTSTEYDWFLTSTGNNTNNYTLYIPPELTAYVNQLFIGVQSVAGTDDVILTLLRKGVASCAVKYNKCVLQ